MPARPLPSNATIGFVVANNDLSFSYISDGGPMQVVCIGAVNTGGGGASDFTATCTFDGVAMQKWASWWSASASDVMRVFVFTLLAPTVGSHTVAFHTAGVSPYNWTGIAYNLADGPVNNGIVLPGGFYSFSNTTTLTKDAYAWDADGTQITIAWARQGTLPTLSLGTTFASDAGGGIVATYADATDGQLTYTATRGTSGALGMFTFLIPAAHSVTGGVCQPWISGITTPVSFTPGAFYTVGLPNGNQGGSITPGRDGNIVLLAGTARSLVVRSETALAAGNSVTCEVVRGGYDTGSDEAGTLFTTRIATVVTLVTLDSANQQVTLDGLNLPFSKYERLNLRYTNTGAGTPATTFSAALLVEAGGGATVNVQNYGGGAMTGDPGALNTAYNHAPLHPWAVLWGSTSVNNQKSLIGISATVSVLLAAYQQDVTLNPDRQYYLRLNGVLQDGTAGTVDTTATLIPNTMGPALGRSQFSLPVVATDYLEDIVMVRNAASGMLRQAATILVTPTTRGEFMLSGTARRAVGSDWIAAANSPADDYNTQPQTIYQLPIPPMTFTGDDLHILGMIGALETAGPGGVTSWEVRLRQNLAFTAMPNMIFTGAQVASSTAGDVAYVGGDTVDLYWDAVGGIPNALRQFWSIPGYLTPPALGGTIIVDKDAGSDTTTPFDFNTVALSPASFSLVGGGSQSFTGLTPGSGYGVSEVVPTGWNTPAVSVSNGDDPDNISVAEGETITVTFTNSLCPGDATGTRQDGLPYRPPSFAPCGGSGTRSGSRTGD